MNRSAIVSAACVSRWVSSIHASVSIFSPREGICGKPSVLSWCEMIGHSSMQRGRALVEQSQKIGSNDATGVSMSCRRSVISPILPSTFGSTPLDALLPSLAILAAFSRYKARRCLGHRSDQVCNHPLRRRTFQQSNSMASAWVLGFVSLRSSPTASRTCEISVSVYSVIISFEKEPSL